MESNQNNRREFLEAGSAALAATAFASSASRYTDFVEPKHSAVFDARILRICVRAVIIEF
jgi:tRNA(His) 5'-end guanylyltransferase